MPAGSFRLFSGLNNSRKFIFYIPIPGRRQNTPNTGSFRRPFWNIWLRKSIFDSLSDPKKKKLYQKQESPLPERTVKTHFEEKMKDKKLHSFNYLRTSL